MMLPTASLEWDAGRDAAGLAVCTTGRQGWLMLSGTSLREIVPQYGIAKLAIKYFIWT